MASIAFYACKKGDIGPAGPQGDTGTANVIYSDWFKPSSYVKDTVFGIYGLSYTITEPKITQDILDKGMVMVYAKLNTYNQHIWPTGQVGLLPISIIYKQGTTLYTDEWTSIVLSGKVKIRFTNDHNLYDNISSGNSFRYVIVSGSVKATGNVDFNDYTAVKKAFSMKD
ncbi:hypothetical protein [Arachidicoccus ginsenosidimutans]|uniref:hypothetical protein n=1 Tax=Arachidicoccus sp. BS20 TaxID=1850526 RepID=UPI0012E93B3F|nr:hypothetical protein [Arachidicoccus sp. BS20]